MSEERLKEIKDSIYIAHRLNCDPAISMDFRDKEELYNEVVRLRDRSTIGKNMDDYLLKIIEYYGVMAQLKYFQSEVFELNEAIIQDEDGFGGKHHITEEIADVMVMLCQFKEYYHIDGNEIMNVMKEKIERQLKRIEEENGR